MHIGSDRSVQCPDFVRHHATEPDGQIWPSPGELDSCRGLRSLQDPKNAELAAKVQNCCPELAVLGPMKLVSSTPLAARASEWRARCKAYAVSF